MNNQSNNKNNSSSSRKPKGYWTKERCHEEALKYRTKSEFNAGSTSAYSATLQNKWFDEIAEHLVTDRKPKGYWTKERCHEIALQYDARNKFKTHNYNAYVCARLRGWLNEICSHMVPKREKLTWTKEKCHQEAKAT